MTTDAAIPRRAAHVAWTVVDDRVYAVSPASPTPFTAVGLSATGSSIWKAIDGVADISAIVRVVADEWAVATEDVAAGVPPFLRQLTDQHLVEWRATASDREDAAPE